MKLNNETDEKEKKNKTTDQKPENPLIQTSCVLDLQVVYLDQDVGTIALLTGIKKKKKWVIKKKDVKKNSQKLFILFQKIFSSMEIYFSPIDTPYTRLVLMNLSYKITESSMKTVILLFEYYILNCWNSLQFAIWFHQGVLIA